MRRPYFLSTEKSIASEVHATATARESAEGSVLRLAPTGKVLPKRIGMGTRRPLFGCSARARAPSPSLTLAARAIGHGSRQSGSNTSSIRSNSSCSTLISLRSCRTLFQEGAPTPDRLCGRAAPPRCAWESATCRHRRRTPSALGSGPAPFPTSPTIVGSLPPHRDLPARRLSRLVGVLLAVGLFDLSNLVRTRNHSQAASGTSGCGVERHHRQFSLSARRFGIPTNG